MIDTYRLSNLWPATSGVTGAKIWISCCEYDDSEHRLGPRIRVVPEGDVIGIDVTLEAPPLVLGELPDEVRDAVIRWVELNRVALLRHWRDETSSGEGFEELRALDGRPILVVRREAESEQLAHERAYDRETYADKLEELLHGALLEHYKSKLAGRNGASEWESHWRSEANGLIQRSLYSALIHDVRGFDDQRDVFMSVVQRVRCKEDAHRLVAERQVLRTLGLSRLEDVVVDAGDFWSRVLGLADDALGASR